MSKIDDLVEKLDWMLPTTVQEDSIREALIEAYNRGVEDAEKSVNEYSDWGQYNLDDLRIRTGF